MKSLSFLITCTCLLLATNSSHAHEKNSDPKPNFLGLSLGLFDVIDDSKALEARIEYRANSYNAFGIKNLHPFISGHITNDASFWLGAGFLYNWKFIDKWYISPSLGAGLYGQGSSDIDLDHILEFRSQIEFGYIFDNDNKLALALSHLSNASFSHHNPGTEVLSLYYHHELK